MGCEALRGELGFEVPAADVETDRQAGILRRRPEGTAIVFASADLDELLRYSDRILVFFAGRIIKEVVAATSSGEELGYLIGGKEAP